MLCFFFFLFVLISCPEYRSTVHILEDWWETYLSVLHMAMLNDCGHDTKTSGLIKSIANLAECLHSVALKQMTL